MHSVPVVPVPVLVPNPIVSVLNDATLVIPVIHANINATLEMT